MNLSCSAFCQSSSVRSRISPPGAAPALLTRMSMRPKRATVASTICRTSSGRVRSPAVANTSAPVAPASSRAASSSDALLREPARDRLADALAASGDQRHAPLQAEIHRRHSFNRRGIYAGKSIRVITDRLGRARVQRAAAASLDGVRSPGQDTTMVNPPRPKRRARLGRRSFLKSSLIAGAVVALGAPGREAGAQVGGTLTLTSYGGPWEEFMRSAVVPAFEKEHPGVKVELAIGLSKDWVAKLKAAGKDNPPFDVVTTNEVWAAPLRAEGRYTKLPHELVPNLKDVAPNLRIKDDTGVLALAGPIGLAYRIDKIKTVPKAWKDLWTVPEYKGKIGIYNIVNSAGQMTICLTSKIWTGGDKDIDTAYKKIAELKPFKQTDFSGDMEKLLVQGEVLIGILDMPAAVRLQKSGAPIGWVAPAEGMLMFEQDVAVTAGSKNKPAAFAYVNWMLKRETQETWLRQFYWLPANTRVKMPDELKPIMPVTPADIPKILQWDWLWINDQKPKLIDRWNREMST